jgi:hypothetical protein
VPPRTRWFLKAVLIYLILALCAGIVLALPGTHSIAGMFPVYIHLLNLGILFVATDVLLHVPWFSLAGRATELLSLLSFALGHWKRIRPSGG